MSEPVAEPPLTKYVDVVLVGDEGCGKKTLVNSLRCILDQHAKHLPISMTVDNIKVEVAVWNTLGNTVNIL